MATQTISDAKLLQTGAEYLKSGRLELTAGQIGHIAMFETPKEQLAEFEGTPEAQAIQSGKVVLLDFKNTVHAHIGDTANYPVAPLKKFSESSVGKVFNLVGLDVADRSVAESLLDRIVVAQQTFTETTLALLQNPSLRFGSEVSILRGKTNEQPGHMEPGWLFTGISADGRLVLVRPKDGQVVLKERRANEIATD